VSSRRKGLTLIELLVVVAIVMFLSSLLIANLASSARRKTYDSATRALVASCEVALTAYRSELGVHPPDLKTLLAPRTRTIFTGDPGDPRSVREITHPPFLVLAKEQISLDGKDILDAWGDPLSYDPTRASGIVWSRNLVGR
jgi:prepilin-type N-terminal cleavage/methylation domain-containing protein